MDCAHTAKSILLCEQDVKDISDDHLTFIYSAPSLPVQGMLHAHAMCCVCVSPRFFAILIPLHFGSLPLPVLISTPDIPEQTLMNVALFTVKLIDKESGDEVLVLNSVTQVNKSAAGGDLIRTSYSPL